jgi:flagellar protein FliL
MACSLRSIIEKQLVEADMAATEKKKKDIKEEDDENENENEPKEPEKKKGSMLKLIIIVAVVLALLAGGGAAAYFFFFKAKPAAGVKSATQEKPMVSVFWPMEPYVVNLIDNDGERYLKVVMHLELSDQKMTEEMKLLNPKLRDTILDLLSSKTYKEMMDPLGKQRLRDEIAMRVNMNLTTGKVLKVYFTEFVIQ